MSETQEPRTLLVSWSTSRGRDTYGYNICRLDDTATRKRYRCMGGGYDMLGTVYGEWLEDAAQEQLRAIEDRAYFITRTPLSFGDDGLPYVKNEDGLYGMSRSGSGAIRLDGGCGLESMRRIADAVGVQTRAIINRRGHTVGFTVTGVSC